MPRRSLGGDMLPSSGCGHAAPRMGMSRSTAPRAAVRGWKMLRGVVLGSVQPPCPTALSFNLSAKMFIEDRGEHALSTLNLFFCFLHHGVDKHLILKDYEFMKLSK